jgi:hypothetical protein
MRCRSIEHNFPDYLRGELDADSEAALEAHLTHCSACRQLRDELRPFFTLLDASKQAAMMQTPGPDFLVAVNRKLDTPTRRWTPGLVFVRLGIPATAAALLLLLAVLVWPAIGPLQPGTRDEAEMRALVESMDTTQLATLRDDLEIAGRLFGASDETDAMLSDAGPMDAAAAPVFSELSYGELMSGSSTFLSSDDVLDIASAAPADAFPAPVQ